ncbi:NAD-dependent succinate-semialdehyde dehydrogenase [Tunturiibacter gelidiferens]|uniref:NAD-dependent succinate-semialdehyde dehydrogenase n=1 Tax=Tunturiibacter gelidiferens TaxID=3069689 RepID=UPI003D9BD507
MCHLDVYSKSIEASSNFLKTTELETFFMPIASINPCNGETLQVFEPLTPDQLSDKIEAAAVAFQSYRSSTFVSRAQRMVRAAEVLERDREKLAELMTLEMGKPLISSVHEIEKCALVCRYYAQHAERYLADEVIETHATKSFVRYQPLGPVLAIMPWNYPLWQVIRFLAPALMAGNTGLLKHASNVPQCALEIERIFLEAGFEEGIFQTLLIGPELVDGMLGDGRIVAATITGSEEAGIKVAVGAARRIKKVVLELGGSDPFIVMPTADLDMAVKMGVRARTLNNGQSCIAAKRFIVAEKVADEFEGMFVAAMKALIVGDPLDAATDVGPLATAGSVRRLHADVTKTLEAGGRALAGAVPLDRPGFFYAPTVLTDIPPDSPAYCEEFFGPVASLFRVKNIDHAIRVANDTRFGLGASAWTSDATERERFVNELDAGMVFINSMVVSDPRLPFGGIKMSGYGRELAVHGIREFVNAKTVWIQ